MGACRCINFKSPLKRSILTIFISLVAINTMQDLLPELCDLYPQKVHVLIPMFKNFGGNERFYGKVITVKCYEDNSLVKQQVAQKGHGQVLVVDGGGSLRRALLGDMLAEQAAQNGWEGLVIYGCIRDVNAIAKLPIGVQALGANPVKTEKRGIGDLNIPVTFAGITITPEDYIYADNNGILVADQALSWSSSK